MDNMSVGYNFEKKLRARLSFTVQNVFTITKYNGLDPEVDGGIDNNFYPRPRVFVLGVNLTF
jgi:iron complex outermembrane receptor protein